MWRGRSTSGRRAGTEELLRELLEDRDLYEISGGGVTFTGGEPLLQAKALLPLLKALGREGIHRAVETCAAVPRECVETVLEHLDLVFCDLKCLSEPLHRQGTGASNREILENLRFLVGSARRLMIRIPVICGFNDGELPAMAEFVRSLPGAPETELLPYHELCRAKYEALGRPFGTDGYRAPAEDELHGMRELFR